MPEPVEQLHNQRAAHRADTTALLGVVISGVLTYAAATRTLWWLAPAIVTCGIAIVFALRAAFIRGYLSASAPPTAPAAVTPAAAGLPPNNPDAAPSPTVIVAGNGVIPVVFTRFQHPVAELDDGIGNEYLRQLVDRLAASQGLPAGQWEFLGERHLRDQNVFEQLWSPVRTGSGGVKP